MPGITRNRPDSPIWTDKPAGADQRTVVIIMADDQDQRRLVYGEAT